MARDYDDDDDDRPLRRSRRLDEEEDDDGRPQARRPARRHYEEDDYDDRPRKKKRKKKRVEQSSMGMVALVIGICSVVLAFVPCIGVVAIVTGLAGLIIGFIAMLSAHKSDGRISGGLPIAGLSVSALSVILAAGWLIFFKKVGNEYKQIEAEVKKEQEERKATMATAAKDVQAATNPIQVTAVQLATAYDNNFEQTDAYYKDKVLDVTGTVEEAIVDEEDDDTYTLRLRGGRQWASIVCEFAKDAGVRAQLKQLRPGAQVTIRGKCTAGGTLIACVLLR
jgi:tRNA_anti-like